MSGDNDWLVWPNMIQLYQSKVSLNQHQIRPNSIKWWSGTQHYMLIFTEPTVKLRYIIWTLQMVEASWLQLAEKTLLSGDWALSYKQKLIYRFFLIFASVQDILVLSVMLLLTSSIHPAYWHPGITRGSNECDVSVFGNRRLFYNALSSQVSPQRWSSTWLWWV